MNGFEGFAIVRRSWDILAGHAVDYLRLAAVPFLMAALLPVAAEAAGTGAVGRAVAALLALAATVPLLTAWLRFVLLGRGADKSHLVLRWRRPETMVCAALARLAGLAALAAVPALMAATVVGQADTPAVLATASGVALWSLVGLAVLPFLLMLPAAAVEMPLAPFAAMRLLGGATLPLALLVVGLALPALLMAVLWPASSALGWLALRGLLLQTLSFAALPLAAAILALTLTVAEKAARR